MKKYVALLRGINVGGNNKIAMTELKVGFESLGYEGVVTYINSGNVIFETNNVLAGLSASIETMIHKKFGLTIRVIVREQSSIAKICKKIPAEWSNSPTEKTDVMFLWPEFENQKSLNLLNLNPVVDSVIYIDGAIVWHLKKTDYAQSGMQKLIGTKIYKNMTVRNINTTRKIDSLMTEQKA